MIQLTSIEEIWASDDRSCVSRETHMNMNIISLMFNATADLRS